MSTLNPEFFAETCREMDSIVGREFTNIKADANQHRETGWWRINLVAECRVCKARIEAGVMNNKEGWSGRLVEQFTDRAEHHAARHRLIIRPS